jgi:hypothetical protein
VGYLEVGLVVRYSTMNASELDSKTVECETGYCPEEERQSEGVYDAVQLVDVDRRHAGETYDQPKPPARKKRQGEPVKGRSAYQLYAEDTTKVLKSQDREWHKGEMQREISSMWKNISERERMAYEANKEADFLRWETEYQSWFDGLDEETRADIAAENEALRLWKLQKKRKDQEAGRLKIAREAERLKNAGEAAGEETVKRRAAPWDPISSNRPPRKPRTAFSFYVESRSSCCDTHVPDNREKEKEHVKSLRGVFKSLSKTLEGRKERERYENMAAEDALRYDREYDIWFSNRSPEQQAMIIKEKEAKRKPLEGQPAGLTEDDVITFLQIFIPSHYVQGETLAWRELIEPELRREHPSLIWEDNPDTKVDKSSLVKSMKAIWNSVGKPIPENTKQLILHPEEQERQTRLERYIQDLIEELETAAKDEVRESEYEKRTKAEQKRLHLEKYICETCLVWWCVSTRKPSLYSLGYDTKAMKYIAEIIQRKWFPNGSPGSSFDWDMVEKGKRNMMENATKIRMPAEQTAAIQGAKRVKVVDGKIVVEIVDSAVDTEKEKLRKEAEKTMRECYSIKIENILKEFKRTMASVDEERFQKEVLDPSGVTWGLGKTVPEGIFAGVVHYR